MAAKKPHPESSWFVITLDDLMPFFVFMLVLVLPAFSSNTNLKVIEQEISVGFNRTAPPFAVLVDEHIPLIEVPTLEKIDLEVALSAGDVNTTSLVSALEGARHSFELSERLFQANLKRKKDRETIESPKPRSLDIRYLEGMTVSIVSKSSDLVAAINEVPKKEIERIPVSTGFAQRLSKLSGENIAFNDMNHDGLSNSGPREQFIEPDFRQPIKGTAELPEKKWVGSILVGKPEATRDDSVRVVSRSSNSDGKEAVSRNKNRRVAQNDAPTVQSINGDSGSQNDDVSTALALIGNTPDADNDVIPNFMKVRGKIELSKGLAFLGGTDQLKVSWRVGLEERRLAEIDQYAGTYELEIDDPGRGAIIAELRGGSGELIAVEELLVSEIIDTYSVQSGYAELSLNLEPIDHSLSGEVFVVDTEGKLQKPAGGRLSISQRVATTLKGAKYRIEEFMRGSTFLSSFRSERSYDGIFFTTVGVTARNTIPSGRLLSKVLELTSFDLSLKESGVVWGQVVSDGRPVKNAVVELSHSPAKGPFYLAEDGSFNEQSTSSLGYYAFVGVPEDTYLVRAVLQDKVYSPQPTVVLNGSVSNANIDINETKEAELYAVDAETFKPLNFSVMFYGDEVEYSSQEGRVELSYSKDSLPLVLEARAHSPGYYPVVASLSKSHKSLFLDLPRRAWVNGLLSKNRISTLPNTGIIVGHILESDFRVNLPQTLRSHRVVYFDRYGDYVNSSGSETGERGGGFIIANVPEGPHQIEIQNLEGEKSFVTEAIVHSDTAFSFQQRL